MTVRKYTSRSQQTTLSSAVTSGATVIPVTNASTLFAGTTISAGQTFTIVIDPDTALEEICDVTAASSNNLTVTRAVDMSGASAQDHSSGAVVRHMIIGRDLRESNLHIEATGSYNDGSGAKDLHGLGTSDGVVVGTTATQTLTNKTLTAPILTGAGVDASIVFEGATVDAFETTLTVVDPTQDNVITLPNTSGTVAILTATQTMTNKTLTSPVISGSPVITGLSSAGMSASSAAPKDYVDSILGSATAASTSAASAATSASSAATSASSAATSASLALTSATSAATSQTAAATSAASAATSATAAATSATSAAASATAAATSAASAAAATSAVATSAASAATSASNAATSASSAATSASSALTSASSAATSASSAASSASAAATSASSAATSATAAATSAASAATSAASAAAAVASAFDAKGDLLVGTGASTFDQLTVAATNGYALTVNSATATGLTWAAIDALPSQATHSGEYLTTDGTTASWAAIQAGSQVKIDGGGAATYDYIDFTGMGTDTGTAGTIKVSPITVTDADPGKRVFVGATTPSSPTNGDIWIDDTSDSESAEIANLTTMVIMEAY